MTEARSLQESNVFVAISRGSLEEVQSIVEQNGAVLKVPDDHGFTPMLFATHQRHLDIVKWMHSKDCEAVTRDKTISHYTCLHLAASQGAVDIAQWLLEEVKVDPNTALPDGFTPLALAAQEGHLAVVQMLYSAGVDINQKNAKQITPMHLAASCGHLAVMQWLRDNGGNTKGVAADRVTPLLLASSGGHTEVVRWLVEVEGCDVTADKTRDNGCTAVLLATISGATETVKYLVQKGASLKEAAKDGLTPFLYAAQTGNLELLEWLPKHGSSMARERAEGNTNALMVACSAGQLECVKWLVNKGFDVYDESETGVLALL